MVDFPSQERISAQLSLQILSMGVLARALNQFFKKNCVI
jgi:hypothetical protein